jgi:hypothetical protein
MTTNKFFLAAAAAILCASCGKDFLDTPYHDGVDAEAVERLLENNPDVVVAAYVTAVYSNMVKAYSYDGATSHDMYSFASILHVADMTGQDMVQASSHWFNYDYDWDNRMADYRRTRSHWSALYTMIADANTIIQLYPQEPTNVGARGGLGQALAIRGLAYYYLIQLYQQSATSNAAILDMPGVPLKFADVEELPGEDKETLKGRNTVRRVHQQIESDLKRAVELLDGYERPVKYYVDKSVAQGFLARFYLLAGKYADAAATAKAAREDYDIMPKNSLHDGFMDIENGEWMWGFDHTTETQTTYASWFSHLSNIAPGYAGMGYAPRLIDTLLYAAIPATDERKTLFNSNLGKPSATGSFASASDRPFANIKFGDKGDWTMDYVYMRAAEMVLIEAEALAAQGNGTEAAVALKDLMEKRDESWNATSVSVDDVFLQRRIELWGEGFNFFDLKRLGKGVVRNYVGSNHRTKVDIEAGAVDWVYQIPTTEMQENPKITAGEQNP